MYDLLTLKECTIKWFFFNCILECWNDNVLVIYGTVWWYGYIVFEHWDVRPKHIVFHKTCKKNGIDGIDGIDEIDLMFPAQI